MSELDFDDHRAYFAVLAETYDLTEEKEYIEYDALVTVHQKRLHM